MADRPHLLMRTFSDEPVLVKPAARQAWKRWLVIGLAITVPGIVLFVPINNASMEEKSHDAERGPRHGTLVRLDLAGSPRTLELTWWKSHLAPVLTPPPPEGVTLHLRGRFGDETLTWNPDLGAFGPTSAEVDPRAHYKVELTLQQGGRPLWNSQEWAYAINDTHSH